MAAEDTHRGSTQTDHHFRSARPREARLSPSASPPTASVPEQFPFSALPVPTALPAKRVSISTSKAVKLEQPAAIIKKERPRRPAPTKTPKQAPEPPPQPKVNVMLLPFVPAPSPYVYPTFFREAKSTMALPTYASVSAHRGERDTCLCVPIAVMLTWD